MRRGVAFPFALVGFVPALGALLAGVLSLAFEGATVFVPDFLDAPLPADRPVETVLL